MLRYIKSGNETMIHSQLGDKVLDTLDGYFLKFNKLGNLYYKRMSITKKEFENEFEIIKKDFNKDMLDRFNLNIQLKNSNTFAVLPLLNIDTNTNLIQSLKGKSDRDKALKQLKDFKKFISYNSITIDLKNSKIENIPKEFEFKLLISIKSITNILDTDDFKAILLHEIGHIFTLLEMYTKTNKNIESLSNSLLTNDTTETINSIIIGNVKETNSTNLVKTYDQLSEDSSIVLAKNKEKDFTDTEYEADSFVNKFGLGDKLVITLNKLTKTKTNFSYENLLIYSFYTMIVRVLISTLLLFLSISPMNIFTLHIYFLISETIYRIGNFINIQSNRNPNDGEHSTMTERFTKIKLSLIETIRTTNLSKDEIKDFLEQIETIEKEIEVVDKSFMDGFFGSFISRNFISNLNTSDILGLVIDKLVNNKLYLNEAKFNIGLESGKYLSKKDPVIDKLINFYTKVTDNSLIKNISDLSDIHTELNDIIYDRFGIPIVTIPATAMGIGFACIPFTMVKESSLGGGIKGKINRRYYLTDFITNGAKDFIIDLHDGMEIIIDNNNKVIKGLDKKKHRSMLFIEYGRDVISRTYDSSTIALRPTELTAITLHEIGHLFTFLESMTKTVKTNTKLQDSLLDYNKIHSEKKLVFNEEYHKDAYELYSDTTTGIINDIKATILETFLILISGLNNFNVGTPINTFLDTSETELGNYGSYVQDTEVIADDFVAAFGLSGHLSLGLNRLITYKLENKFLMVIPYLVNFAISILTTIIFRKRAFVPEIVIHVFLASIGFWMMTFIFRLIFNSSFPYEKLSNRIDSMKRSMIKILRTSDLSKEQEKEIMETIEMIEDNFKSIEKSGYNSFIMSIILPNFNSGKELKPTKENIMLMDRLLNNDLYVSHSKFKQGLEGKLLSDKTNIFFTESQLYNDGYLSEVLKRKKEIKLFNDVLFKYNIEIGYDKKESTLKAISKNLINIRSGISTIAFIPNNNNENVIVITIESDKVLWQLENPYIKVFNVDVISISELKNVYIMELEKIDTDNSKFSKHINKIQEALYKNYFDYGKSDFKTEMKVILDTVKLNKDLTIQFKLLEEMITRIHGNDVHSSLDLHDGNFAINKNKKIVLLDPVFNRVKMGHKQSNKIEIDKSKLSVKEGIEKSGHGGFIMSTILPNPNSDEELKSTKENIMLKDKLVNNKIGLEGKLLSDKANTFFTENYLHNDRYLSEVLKRKKEIKLFNDILFKYNIEIDYDKKDSVLKTISKNLIDIKSDISTITFIPNNDESIIVITLESDKVLWHLENPYIKVFNVDVISMGELKNVYIMELEKVDTDNSKYSKYANKIQEVLNKNYLNYGIIDFKTEMKVILDTVKLNKDLTIQFKLLEKMITRIHGDKIYSRIYLPEANFAIDKNKKIVLLDPIFNSVKMGHKQSNKIEIDKSKLSVKEGVENLTLENKEYVIM